MFDKEIMNSEHAKSMLAMQLVTMGMKSSITCELTGISS